ncbi:hypothetical protein ES288_D12G262200v1 [Gossypium darwinii]|uniref:Uncharacterized protein n=1 Tax=Gossypium darwinii TaxID=34276 RepID=A0A5D2AGR6_GOSDA|nr:hypothetical protein ES288_D12G262200v1 [Gossypium darwinii]
MQRARGERVDYSLFETSFVYFLSGCDLGSVVCPYSMVKSNLELYLNRVNIELKLYNPFTSSLLFSCPSYVTKKRRRKQFYL